MSNIFLSYSNADAATFAVKLANAATKGPPPAKVWFDKRKMIAGRSWDSQIDEAIKACDCLLFVMTGDSVRDNSVCHQEWSRALTYKKPLVPLRLHTDAVMPFRLEGRHYIDFVDDFDLGIAMLSEHLLWLKSPEGELQALKDRRADAERDLARAEVEGARLRIEREIAELANQIDQQERFVADPAGAAKQTDESIKRGMELERRPARQVSDVTRTKFINPPPMIAPGYFQDRYQETKAVGDFLRDGSTRLLTVVGRGGVGKTAMVCRLLKALEQGRLPDDLGEMPVDGIVYLGEAGAHRVSADNLYADLVKLLPADAAAHYEALGRDAAVAMADKMAALLEAFPDGRTVVLLDNLETLVNAEDARALSDEELDEALRALLAAPHHGVVVIATTRVDPRALRLFQGQRQRTLELDRGLESPHAEETLRGLDPGGSLGLRDASENLLDRARQRTRGYPRALEMIGSILAVDRRATLEELVAGGERPLHENVVEVLVSEAFNRLERTAQLVMQALAVYARPVSPVAVDYLLQPTLPGINSAPVLDRLYNMYFARYDQARRDRGRYHLHQVDLAYALAQIPEGSVADRPEGANDLMAALRSMMESGADVPEDLRALRQANPQQDKSEPPFTCYALRHRAADYFKETRLPRAQWKSLADLEPQLAEFELRFEGEEYAKAAAILVEIDFLLLWGHFHLMAGMHERLLPNLTDDRQRRSSHFSLGNAHHSTGQAMRAIEHYEAALAISRDLKDRQGEGACLGNLGLAYAALGRVEEAIKQYEQALLISREIGDRSGEALHTINVGDALVAQGRLVEARPQYEAVVDDEGILAPVRAAAAGAA